jgi:hypothetical protein
MMTIKKATRTTRPAPEKISFDRSCFAFSKITVFVLHHSYGKQPTIFSSIEQAERLLGKRPENLARIVKETRETSMRMIWS